MQSIGMIAGRKGYERITNDSREEKLRLADENRRLREENEKLKKENQCLSGQDQDLTV
jgi:cell division protein FtsB